MNDRRTQSRWNLPADRGGFVDRSLPAVVACPAIFTHGLSKVDRWGWQAIYLAAARSAVARIERDRAIAIAAATN